MGDSVEAAEMAIAVNAASCSRPDTIGTPYVPVVEGRLVPDDMEAGALAQAQTAGGGLASTPQATICVTR